MAHACPILLVGDIHSAGWVVEMGREYNKAPTG